MYHYLDLFMIQKHQEILQYRKLLDNKELVNKFKLFMIE